MNVKVFFELVEIRTKIASLFPFLIAIVFSLTYFKEGNLWNTVLFFIGMLVFDMTTTAINNLMDYQKAKSDVYKYEHNVIGKEGLDPKKVSSLILCMLVFTLLIGLILSLRTGWLLLLMGGIVCFIGIFYTFGPIPLSRMPLGEIFSGVTMGLGIFAITVYINTPLQKVFYLAIDFKEGLFSLTGNLWGVAAIILASLPLIFTIANLMLANNLRDLEADIENHRYTLVYYIGRDIGVILFQTLMYSSYLAILLGWLLGVFEWPILIVFMTLPKIRKNLKEHKESLPHPRSFGYGIKNLVLFNSMYFLGLIFTLLWQQF